jgi:hypothetical protein
MLPTGRNKTSPQAASGVLNPLAALVAAGLAASVYFSIGALEKLRHTQKKWLATPNIARLPALLRRE